MVLGYIIAAVSSLITAIIVVGGIWGIVQLLKEKGIRKKIPMDFDKKISDFKKVEREVENVRTKIWREREHNRKVRDGELEGRLRRTSEEIPRNNNKGKSERERVQVSTFSDLRGN